MSTARKTAYPDVTTVIAIASEMAVNLEELIKELPAFSDNAQSVDVSEKIAHVTAAASLISLRVVSVIGDEIAELAHRIQVQRVRDAGATVALRDAIVAMHRYVGVAATGKVSSGTSIYPAYEALAALMPDRRKFTQPELFLPVSPMYGKTPDNYDEASFVREVARYQPEFSSALAGYRAERGLESVHAMRTTLVTIEAKNPPGDFRLLISLAIGFMDVALQTGGAVAKDDEAMLEVIEKALIRAAAADLLVEDAVISALLHVVAQATQSSPRIRQFQDIYELDRLFAEETAKIDEGLVDDAKSYISDSERAWKNVAAEDGNPQLAKAAVFKMAGFFATLGDYALKTMSISLGQLVDSIVSGKVEKNQEIAIFGASILIAMSDRIERILQDPKGGRAVADFHKDRVRAVVSGTKPSDLQTDLPEQNAHVQSILDEITADVQSAEQIVEQCLRGEISEQHLENASKLFNTIYCALIFVNMEAGAEFVQHVGAEVETGLRALLAGEDIPAATKTRIAESVMLLNRFLSLHHVDSNQAHDALRKGKALFEAAPEVSVVSEDAIEGPSDICTDEDIGPIFYDEAKEVVNTLILPGVAKLRSNPSDEKTFLDVRRGFHTLKGSARMVELMNLGMIGQHVEFALNIIRDDKGVTVTQELLDWLESSAKFFDNAIAVLETGKAVPANPEPFRLVYENFRDTKVFTRTVSAAAIAPVSDEAQRLAAVAKAEADAKTEAMRAEESAKRAAAEESERAAAEEQRRLEAVRRAEAEQQEAARIEAAREAERLEAQRRRDEERVAEQEAARRLEEERVAEQERVAAEREAEGQRLLAAEIPESEPMVSIGTVQLAPALYEAFTQEAGAFCETMEKRLNQVFAGEKDTIGFEFMRLAHSLAGMGRTTGLHAIADLAHSIETWSALAQDRSLSLDQASRSTLGDSMAALKRMVLDVELRIEPRKAPELVSRMKEVIAQNEYAATHSKGAEDIIGESLDLMPADTAPKEAPVVKEEITLEVKPEPKAVIQPEAKPARVDAPKPAKPDVVSKKPATEVKKPAAPVKKPQGPSKTPTVTKVEKSESTLVALLRMVQRAWKHIWK